MLLKSKQNYKAEKGELEKYEFSKILILYRVETKQKNINLKKLSFFI